MPSRVLDWLLEEDPANPSVSYFAYTDILGYPHDDPAVSTARLAMTQTGSIPAILAAQNPAGYWEQPGPGYYPKYRGTVWSLVFLAQLGADPANLQVRAGAEQLLTHAIASTGVFTATGTPAGQIYCLSGNLGAALLDLGYWGDERLFRALELMAHYVTGSPLPADGGTEAALQNYRSGVCGPAFRCSANDRLPCAWGGVKVLRALARVPEKERTPVMQSAMESAVDLLLGVDPATAGYPAGYSDKPSRSWFRFGFPLFYVTDVLQAAEALTEAGYGGDPRLASLLDLIQSKHDPAGRWRMEYSYNGKTCADIEQRGKPSKWVTLRALRVLTKSGRQDDRY